MLMRTDPFRELDRLTQQVFGTAAPRPGRRYADGRLARRRRIHRRIRPARRRPDSVDLDVERNVVDRQGRTPGPGRDQE